VSADEPELRASVTGGRLAGWLVGGAVAALAVALACSLVGRSRVWGDSFWTFPWAQEEVWRIRCFRLLVAALVGAALAVSGLALQGLLRNPLAEPYILGISSGAGLGVLAGATLAVKLALPAWATTPVLAVAGSLTTAALVYAIAQRRGRLDPYVLLLSGVVVNVFNGALILALFVFTRPLDLLDYVAWSMGHVQESMYAGSLLPPPVLAGGAAVLAGGLLVLWRGSSLNALALGDEVASSGGVAVGRLRIEIFVLVCLMTAAAVALAGPIGFVGLIVPHIGRLLLGPDHRRLTVVCAAGGAVLLMLADTLCRLLAEWLNVGTLPIGVITALAGGPFFIVLLRRRFREGAA